MTAPVRRPLSGNQLATLVFSAVVLICMVCVPTSREWMWDQFADLTRIALTALGADLTPIT